MNFLARFLACSTLLCVSVPFAKADVISGGVEVSGGASYDTSTLFFIQPFASNADSGAFASFSGGTVNYLLGTVSYMGAIGAPLEAFTITNANGDLLAFYDELNSPTQTVDPITGNLDLTFNESGYYTVNGGSVMAGSFSLSLQGGSATGSVGTVTFDGTGEASAFVGDAPEPASCFLLGTGLFGLAGLAAVRRRSGIIAS